MAEGSAEESVFLTRGIEVAIRIAVVAGLALWCFEIVEPFVQPVLWAIVIAVAIHPLHRRLARSLGGRPRTAGVIVAVLALIVLLTPTVLLTGSLMETAVELSGELREGEIAVPPPPAAVADWPVVGERLHASWKRASENLESVLQQYAPQLRAVGQWIITTAAATGMGILKFVLSLVLTGVLLGHAEGGRRTADAISTRLIGARGPDLTTLAISTIQSVTRGILVVALLQSILVGLGCLVVGLPAAGLWAVLVLLFAIVQLPVLVVTLPLVLYVFSTASTLVAVAFAVWNVAVGLSDNVLKPMLLGRGVEVPMIVIFLGSIGGFVLNGIIGLFIGAVVLALGYNLFVAWLGLDQASAAEGASGTAS
jgi:predicted PurR-regulated permease PerM